MGQKLINSILSLLLILSLSCNTVYSNSVHQIAKEDEESDIELTNEQKNSISMLNYLSALTKDINDSRNSRLYLEEAYSSILSNMNPNAVDSTTESYLTFLLDTLESYRMIAVKRERLDYIYDQNIANAIHDSIPNPLSLLSAVTAKDFWGLAMSVSYMGTDSYSNYKQGMDNAESDYLNDGWQLDDEEAEELHNSRKDAFIYMLEIVRDYDLPGEYALSEDDINKFIEQKNNTNVTSRIQYLESKEDTYKMFGYYWLELSSSYFENEQYSKCLIAVRKYENVRTNIFRKDYDYARIIPLIITAAKEDQNENDYVKTAIRYLKDLESNVNDENWELIYFAAQAYIDLYGITKDESYLKKAYTLTLNNVNYLVKEQQKQNKTYLSKVDEEKIPKTATKDEKKEIKKYNKIRKKLRKTELPPVYQPLKLNCDLLFALANEYKASKKDRKKIESILHDKSNPVFLTEPINRYYSFNENKSSVTSKIEIDYRANEISIPTKYVSENTKIIVTITNGHKSKKYEDWNVKKVKREKDGNLDSFKTIFKCKSLGKGDYIEKSKIEVELNNGDAIEPLTFQFKVKEYNSFLVFKKIKFSRIN